MPSIIIALLLVTLGSVARLLPHMVNVAPITAIGLFAGIYLPRRYAIIAPLLAMLVSDFAIGFYDPRIMLSVYVSFAIAGAIGILVGRKKTWTTVAIGTLGASFVFFLITNAAVWYFGTMYSHDIVGLWRSYTMALPFFRNSLIGDISYTFLLVGGMEFITNYLRQQKQSPFQLNKTCRQ